MPHFIESGKACKKRQYLLWDHLIYSGDKKGKVSDMQALLHIWNIILLILALGYLKGPWSFFASVLTEENLCVVCLSAPPNCFWISQSISITLSGGGAKVSQILHSLTFKENRSQSKRQTQMCAPMRKNCRLTMRQSTRVRKRGKQFSLVLQSVVLFVFKIRFPSKGLKKQSRC